MMAINTILGNNDIVIDERGVLKLLILNDDKTTFSFLKSSELIEVALGICKENWI